MVGELKDYRKRALNVQEGKSIKKPHRYRILIL